MGFMGKDVVHIGVVPLIRLLINHPHLGIVGNTCYYILCLSLFYFQCFRMSSLKKLHHEYVTKLYVICKKTTHHAFIYISRINALQQLSIVS